MVKTRLLVVGAGGHGRSVAEAAELSGQFEVVGFLDDSLPAGATALGLPVLGPVAHPHDQTCGNQHDRARRDGDLGIGGEVAIEVVRLRDRHVDDVIKTVWNFVE